MRHDRDALLNLLLVLSAILAGFTGLGGVERLQQPEQIELRAQVEVATAAFAAVADAVTFARQVRVAPAGIAAVPTRLPAPAALILPDLRARILGERRSE